MEEGDLGPAGYDSPVTFGAPDTGTLFWLAADVAFEDALVEYAGCMRDHGIDMPDPDFSGEGGMMIELGQQSPGNEEEFEKAHRLCQPILAGAGLDF